MPSWNANWTRPSASVRARTLCAAALTNLAHSQEVAIFLDRRVDPDQAVDLVVESGSLRELLQQLAEQLKLGVGRVGPVVYLGPPPTAAVLGTVTAWKEDQDRPFPAAVRDKLRRTQPLQWPELTTPRELVQRLARDAGLQVEGLEQIPHDLWPEVDLPPLNFAQAMSLILAGFGLTFDYVQDGSAIRLTPLPVKASITRRIPLRGSPAVVGTEIRRRFPGARFTIEGGNSWSIRRLKSPTTSGDCWTARRPAPSRRRRLLRRRNAIRSASKTTAPWARRGRRGRSKPGWNSASILASRTCGISWCGWT